MTRGAILFALAIAGCVADGQSNLPAMRVDFAFAPSDRCGTTSPVIRVEDAPAAVRRFSVNMTDLDAPAFVHGGGRVDRPADGVIPAGALQNYRGPCPPTRHTYRITVTGLDANGTSVAAGQAQRPFPP